MKMEIEKKNEDQKEKEGRFVTRRNHMGWEQK